MPSYVAFLRAINLGAHRRFPKDAIRAAVERVGGTDVETYINTGNVRLTTSMRSADRVRAALEQAFLEDRGFEVPTVLLTPVELAAVGADVSRLAEAHPAAARHHVWLLRDEPAAPAVASLHERVPDGVHLDVRGRAAHVLLDEARPPGSGDPLRIERSLGVATNRNVTVVRTLAERWGR